MDTVRLLNLAIAGIEAEILALKTEALQLRYELKQLGTGKKEKSSAEVSGPAKGRRRRKKRTMSAEARRKISEGMKARYANLRRLANKRR